MMYLCVKVVYKFYSQYDKQSLKFTSKHIDLYIDHLYDMYESAIILLNKHMLYMNI